MAHLWLTSFAYRTPGQAFASACPDCLGQTLTASVVDNDPTNLSYTYSRGWVNLGYYDAANNNATIATGGTTKSSGNATPDTIAGDTSGGNTCDQGWVSVTALVPTQGTGPFNGHYGWKTDITVYLNGSVLGTVSSGESPGGSTTTQTFTYTRGETDLIHVEYGSSAEFIKLVDSSTVQLNGVFGPQNVGRAYIIQPTNAIAYYNSIPSQLTNANINFDVDTFGKTIDITLNSPVGTSDALGSVFIYHGSNAGKSITLDVDYTAPTTGGGKGPGGGLA
jgi:hypothetical protein